MLRLYEINGRIVQFEEGNEPEGAKLIEKAKPKQAEPEVKEAKPKNKARATKSK